jgi:hypothetical protein
MFTEQHETIGEELSLKELFARILEKEDWIVTRVDPITIL